MPTAISCIFVYYLASAFIWDSVLLCGFFMLSSLWNKLKTYSDPQLKHLSASGLVKTCEDSLHASVHQNFPLLMLFTYYPTKNKLWGPVLWNPTYLVHCFQPCHLSGLLIFEGLQDNGNYLACLEYFQIQGLIDQRGSQIPELRASLEEYSVFLNSQVVGEVSDFGATSI